MSSVPEGHLSPEDFLVLYAVKCSPDGIPAKTHYQKLMYWIFKALGDDPRNHDYHPHHVGPYSDEMERILENLINTGYLINNSKERISLNPELRERYDKLNFNDPILDESIESITEFITSLTEDELLLYIYAEEEHKPDCMIIDSEINIDIISRRVDIAVKMVADDKVSMAKGAELADMDILEFSRLVKKAVAAGEQSN